MVVAREGRDQPGFMLFGPYSPLKTGAYQATFALSAAGVRPDELVAMIEVIGRRETLRSPARLLTAASVRPGRLTEIDLSFATPGDCPIQTRVYYPGRGTVRAGPVQVERIAPAAGHRRISATGRLPSSGSAARL